jgi:hypothetical protein
MRVELNFAYTAEDLQEFQKNLRKIAKSTPRRAHDARERRAFWRQIVGWSTVLVITICVYVAFRKAPPTPAAPIATRPAAQASDSWINVVPYAIIFMAVWWYFLSRIRRLRTKQAIADDPALAQRRVVISDDGVNVQLTSSSTQMAWTHFAHFAETTSLLVLMISRYEGLILPKRAFASPHEVAEFRGFAQAHIGNTPIGFPVEVDGRFNPKE